VRAALRHNVPMKILLIGGSGFIGPHAASALLRRGHDVVVFHRGRAPAPPGTSELLGDRRRLRDHAAALRALNAEVAVDLVLSSGAQARALMDVFRGAAARVVALSSCDVYRACGITHGLETGPLEPLPLTESSALRTGLQTYPPAQVRMLQQVFGWLDEEYDKIPVEREILGDGALPGTVLRLPMVYGPGDPLHRFQPIVKRVLDGRREIPFSAAMAGWRATKGYVEDVGEAVALAAISERASGRVYNVGEADAPPEIEWARLIAGALRWDGEFRVLPDDRLPPFLRAPGNTAQAWVTDTRRIRAELGFAERVPREEAVRRTAEWESANPPSGFTPHAFDYDAEDAALDRAPA
jgi:nucleoside-diphosphate-sugar epimerase